MDAVVQSISYSLCCAPEIFQRIVSDSLSVIECVLVYADDLLVQAETLEENNKQLEKMFVRSNELNLKFNFKKCKFVLTEVRCV